MLIRRCEDCGSFRTDYSEVCDLCGSENYMDVDVAEWEEKDCYVDRVEESIRKIRSLLTQQIVLIGDEEIYPTIESNIAAEIVDLCNNALEE